MKAAATSQADLPDAQADRGRVPAAASPAPPATDALHFDLICDVHGRVITPPSPRDPGGTWPAGERSWRFRTHDIIDLETMRICDPASCRTYGPRRLPDVNAERILLSNSPGLIAWVRRGDGYYYDRLDEGPRVSVTTGHCTMEPFSGFPPIVPDY